MSLQTIAVVGASLAGLRGAEELRRCGYGGRLVLIGAERHLPYDRPPLSKEILTGRWDVDRLALCKPDAWDALALDLRLGRRATRLDLAAREVELDDGERIRFDGLLIATGSTPRLLPNTPPLAGIHTLRSLDDGLAIRAALEKSPRVAIVGAGFIGAEVASSCRARGLDVTLIEALPAPLARGIGYEMGSLLGEVHRDHGVDLRLDARVEAFEGSSRVERLRLSDGSVVGADLVVVGIGVAPEVGWLASSGLELDDGVVCDETCAASAPGVVAAGDVARWYNPRFGERMRLEHWTHAVEQGVAAARRLLAGDDGAEPFAPVPFVWSDQYDVKIQVAGHAREGDESRVVHGSLVERRFVTLYGRAGRLVGALAFNRSRQLMGYRRLMQRDATWAEALAHAEQEAG